MKPMITKICLKFTHVNTCCLDGQMKNIQKSYISSILSSIYIFSCQLFLFCDIELT